MANVAVYDMSHNQVGEISLNDEFFNVEMNAGLLHQAVVLQLASQRLGTHATKTRGLVRGGGRKPWRQKGTGRARAGSTRSPLWVGGGTVFGPHPRKYGFTMPRKQRRLALKCADEAVNVERSTSNIPGVKAVSARGINVFDILHHDKLFITKDAITRIEEVFA